MDSVIHENTVGMLTIVFFEITEPHTTGIDIDGFVERLLSMQSFLNKLNEKSL